MTPYLATDALDLEDFTVLNGDVYFTTAGDHLAPVNGVPGGSDTDVFRFNHTNNTFSRVFNSSQRGVPANANADGLSYVDANHFFMSFTDGTRLGNFFSGLTVADEDVAYFSGTNNFNGSWSLWFDGSTHGLSSNNGNTDAGRDLDAIDVPLS